MQGVLVCRSAKLEDFSGYAVDLRDLLIPGQLLEKIENFPKFRLSHSHRDAESINTIKWGVTTLVSLLELYLYKILFLTSSPDGQLFFHKLNSQD